MHPANRLTPAARPVASRWSAESKLRAANDGWKQSRNDAALVAEVAAWADEFSKERPTSNGGQRLQMTDLELICFEYVTA